MPKVAESIWEQLSPQPRMRDDEGQARIIPNYEGRQPDAIDSID